MSPPHIADRLLRRELGDHRYAEYSSVRGLHGDHRWVEALDIVNELTGHAGCVNALSWSRSGQLLASGSDDTMVNIHRYAPETIHQFEGVATIATGHTQNIFSVKFMPHSNDRTIVTAAGDHQVRIFDIEYNAKGSMPSQSNNRVGQLGLGARLLTEGDTNAKVFQCHNDRVKRIVTESSPFFFLTCSEDGDVRQWDTRQPSSAYPAPQIGGRFMTAMSHNSIPEPLISYRKYGLDLNTISCSPSQPHYIAVGGSHLHCFLHDRRFLGRDFLAERGASRPFSSIPGDRDDDALGHATQCVRKFAPNGQPQMKVKDKGHVTACKISDAYPNELIVSWSEDSIYSFDIIRDPEKGDKASSVRSSSNRVKESEIRKRKRPRNGSNESQDDVQQTADRLREESPPLQEFLRVRYGNGQQEDIPIGSDGSDDTDGEGRSARAHAIATNLVKIRNEIFKAVRLTSPVDWKILDEPDFALILHTAADIIPVIDETVASWPYSDDSAHLRRGQQAACRRFIQAAGLLARVLGGKPPMYGEDEQEKREKWASTMWRHFDYIGCVSATEDSPILVQNESIQIPPRAQFYYDFLKAICLWLDSGVGTMLNRFSSLSGRGKRFPIKSNPSVAAFDSVLIPYLERLASDKPITSVDVSRFEHDENRILFATEEEAVVAFGKALETPFTDLSRDGTGQSENRHSQDREEARLFWAYTVGRAVLMNAAKMEHELPFLNHTFAYNAFGGISRPSAEIRAAEREFLSRHEDVGTPSAVSDDDEDEYGSDAGSYEEYEEESSEDDYEGYESFSGHANWGQAFERRKIRERAAINVQCSLQTRTYSGHCNKETVKDVNFFGRDDEYIVSGSDCGNLFIWDKKTSEIVNILQGDSEVVNVATGHPYEPMLAVSGIDNSIKIFSPDQIARQNAREGVTARHPNPRPNRRLIAHHTPRTDPRFAARGPASIQESDDEDAEDAEDRIATNGLQSRKRLHLEYQITAENEHMLQHPRRGGFIPRALLNALRDRFVEGELEGMEGVDPADCAVQ